MIGLALSEGLRNVRRHRALSIVVAGSTGLVLLLAAFLLAIGQAVIARLHDWERQVELVAYVSPDVDGARVVYVQEALAALPGVAGVAYTSPAEGWQELIEDAGAAPDLASAAEVSLIAGAFTLQVEPDHVGVPQLEALAARAGAIAEVEDVEFAADLLVRYAGLRRTLRGLMGVGVALLAAFLVGLTTVTLRLGHGSREVELRSWVWEGASPTFLRTVIAAEAAAQGLLGSTWALCAYSAGERLAARVWGLNAPPHGALFLVLLALGPLLCLFASQLSGQRVLRRMRLAGVLGLFLWYPGADVAQADATRVAVPRTTEEFDSARVRRDLDRVREQRELVLEETARLSGESRGLLDELEQVGIIEDTLHNRINDLQQREAKLAEQVSGIEARLASTQEEYTDLASRVVRISKILKHTRPATTLDVVLANAPHGRALRTSRVRRTLLQYRLAAFGQLERVERETRAQRDSLRAARAESVVLAAQLEADIEVRAAAQAERRALLHTLQSEQAVAAATVAELEASLGELTALLAGLETGTGDPSQFFGPVPFPELRGILPWPLEGARVARRFGRRVAPVFLTVTRHEGWLLVHPAAGAPVRAVHDGEVEYAGWLHGYGKLVVLNHGGGHRTLYGHCAELFVAPGQVVRAGDVVATIGTTGPLAGPALYFAVRVEGRAEDPATWLAPQEG